MRPVSFVLLAILSLPSSARSQGSPAFDSNVYFPDLDNPDEIETLVSAESDPYREIVKTIPASEVSPYGQLMFLGPPGVSHKIAKGGPDFTTERIKSPQNLYLPDEAEIYFAHFRGPKYTDMLCKYYLFNGYRIYWSDDEGNYSPSRYSSLIMPIDTGVIGYWPDRGAYVTDLDDDDLDDLVLIGEYRQFIPHQPESLYFFQYNAKTSWRNSDSIPPTEKLLASPNEFGDFSRRSLISGDYRGTGKKDVVARDLYGNMLFYRHTSPFSLEEFRRAMVFDTIWATWQNPHVLNPQNISYNIYPLDAIPGATSFPAEELLLYYITDDDRNESIFFYKGDENFGTKRLFLDSANFVMYPPWHYDDRFEGLAISELQPTGDITGTGNGSLMRKLTELGNTYYLFYVLGEALDDKVDMTFYTTDNASAGGDADSLTVNPDKYQDVAIIHHNAEDGKGAMYIVKGSSKIPVRLNPAYADVSEGSRAYPLQASVKAFPNPFRETIRVELPRLSEQFTLTLYDMMGRLILRASVEPRAESFEFSPDIPTGHYVLQLRSKSTAFDVPIVKR